MKIIDFFAKKIIRPFSFYPSLFKIDFDLLTRNRLPNVCFALGSCWAKENSPIRFITLPTPEHTFSFFDFPLFSFWSHLALGHLKLRQTGYFPTAHFFGKDCRGPFKNTFFPKRIKMPQNHVVLNTNLASKNLLRRQLKGLNADFCEIFKFAF